MMCKSVYSPNTAVEPIVAIACCFGSPKLTDGRGGKTGVSLLMGRGGKTGVSLSGMQRQDVTAGVVIVGLGLGETRSGGFGGGRTSLGPDPTSQFLPRHSLSQAFMVAKTSAGMSFAFTWLSLFLQLEKQYLLRNQRGQHPLRLSMCLLAKFIAQVSLASMQSSG